jgi:Lrp/AsnC family leucine-responsive transcriptional regulator
MCASSLPSRSLLFSAPQCQLSGTIAAHNQSIGQQMRVLEGAFAVIFWKRSVISQSFTHILYKRKVRTQGRHELTNSGIEKPIDSLGWKLLIELQKDARISYAELGRRVGLSTPAVAARVRRMEDEGIIRAYRADINPSHVGLPITAFIRMSVVGDVLAKLTAQVRSMPEIGECHRGTGADSFIMKVNVVSVEHLNHVIDCLTPYGTTSSSLVLTSIIERNLLGPGNLDWPAE